MQTRPDISLCVERSAPCLDSLSPASAALAPDVHCLQLSIPPPPRISPTIWRRLLGAGHQQSFRRIKLHLTCVLWGGQLGWHLKGIARELRHLFS